MSCRGRGYHVEGRGYLFSQFLLINGSGQKYHTGAGPTFRGGVRGRHHGSLMTGGGGSQKTPWVSDDRWEGRERHHGSLSVGGEGGGSARTPWVSDGRWEGRQKHRGSPMVGGAGGVGKDTMDL